jgi:hypothetical protein
MSMPTGNIQPAKPSKQRIIDGFTFRDSKEARRYVDLKINERLGKISALEVHKLYKLYVNGLFIDTYTASFEYWDVLAKRKVTEDAARFRPDVYHIKRKLMRACLGIDILET